MAFARHDAPNATTSCHFNAATDHVGVSDDLLLRARQQRGSDRKRWCPKDA
jgi:hypothetical protein